MPLRRLPLCCLATEALEPRLMLSGVTLITHGFQADGARPAWIDAWAEAIVERIGMPGVDATRYDLTIFENGSQSLTKFAGDPDPATTASGEIVLTLDWSERSNDFFLFGDGSDSTAEDIAAEVLPALVGVFPAIGIASPLAELPLHLIGHSRGGSLVSDLARQLGEQGIWVDQVTMLDPHPLTTDDVFVSADEVDPQPQSYENILFAEDYWREDSSTLDFNGQPVAGAFTYQLDEDILTNGGYSIEHSDVHLFHYGTIDTSPGATEAGQGVPAEWYPQHGVARETIGFHYSRLGGGDRLSTADPGGSRTNRIVDGFHAGLGGAGERTALDLSAAVWSNAITFGLAAETTFTQGGTIDVAFHYQDVDSAAVISFSLDPDENPYNGNSIFIADQSLAATGGSIVAGNASLMLPAVASGNYFIAAAISDGGHTRYAYADAIDIVSPVVETILVRGSDWNDAFLDHLDAQGLGHPTIPRLGYVIDEAMTESLPWINIDTITAVAPGGMPSLEDLTLAGSPDVAPPPMVQLFDGSQSPAFHWTLDAALVANRYRVSLPAFGFELAFNVLPGDADGNETVNILDGLDIRSRLFTSAGNASYAVQTDLDGNATINILDGLTVRDHLFSTLPNAGPAESFATTPSDAETVSTSALQTRGPVETQRPFVVERRSHRGLNRAIALIALDVAVQWSNLDPMPDPTDSTTPESSSRRRF